MLSVMNALPKLFLCTFFGGELILSVWICRMFDYTTRLDNYSLEFVLVSVDGQLLFSAFSSRLFKPVQKPSMTKRRASLVKNKWKTWPVLRMPCPWKTDTSSASKRMRSLYLWYCISSQYGTEGNRGSQGISPPEWVVMRWPLYLCLHR